MIEKPTYVPQVGGDHYQVEGQFQHWDLAIMYKWDPFQYQITKYVMRWKDKHDTPAKRLEDLKKARSFLDKYIAVYEEYDTHRAGPQQATAQALPIGDSDAHFSCEGWYGNGVQLYKCRHCRKEVAAPTLGLAHAQHSHPEFATPNYVNQG